MRFGEFTLKSGRISPYFFNSGLFSEAADLSRLGEFYAAAVEQSAMRYDMLFGAAYKGIPLASAMAIALYRNHDKSVPCCFNRKEVKDHGEGGGTFGAELRGKVVIVDDVVSAGTSITLCADIIRQSGGSPAGAVVALDRQERGQGRLSAAREIAQSYGIEVLSIIDLDDIMDYIRDNQNMRGYIGKINEYRLRYGADV